MNLVSIIIPSYNQAAYLETTLLSVLGQEYPRIETIVIDGGSTDGSVDIIRSYEQRLTYWVSEKDSGQAEAINKGMKRAKGEIVAWLNSDDFYLPNIVRSAVLSFERYSNASLIYADMHAVDERGRTFNTFRYKQLSLADLLSFQIIGQPAVFMRRSAFESAGGLDPSYHLLLDHHLWIRIAALGRIVHIPRAWAAARYHAEAKNSARASEFGAEAFRILKWAKTQSNLAPVLSRVVCRARASAHRVDARYLLDGGQPAASLAAWTRAFLFHPPTALARLNILGSALLNLTGLEKLREKILKRRRSRYQ